MSLPEARPGGQAGTYADACRISLAAVRCDGARHRKMGEKACQQPVQMA
jgi:hypothetical protein